jgi:hypothetical protein
MTAASASASVDISASPTVVYALITDLTTLSELAAETTAMSWRTGSSAAPGAVFKGSNRNGWHRWSTTCTITDAEPDRVFAFDVNHSPPKVPVSRWQYDIEATTTGCRVTESTWDRRPGWFRRPAQLATGVRDRSDANLEHIEETLRRLKARAESSP